MQSTTKPQKGRSGTRQALGCFKIGQGFGHTKHEQERLEIVS